MIRPLPNIELCSPLKDSEGGLVVQCTDKRKPVKDYEIEPQGLSGYFCTSPEDFQDMLQERSWLIEKANGSTLRQTVRPASPTVPVLSN